MIYRALYHPSTAALLVLASGILLATGQTRAIVDAVAIVHPTWSPVWHWTTAIGFEVAIVAVGLVMAMTGDRALWRWEVVLVVVSIAAGLTVAIHKQDVTAWPTWARAVATGLIPLQYLAVVLTGHRLADHGQHVATTAASGHTVVLTTATDGQAANVADHDHGVITGPRPPTKTTATTNDPAVAAAIAAGVARTTARRWAANSDPRLDKYRPAATANGHAPLA